MPPDPFTRHNIRMLSASSVALYRSEPAFWVLRHLFRIKDEAGVYAWRGRAVEAGVDLILYKNCPDDEAIETALRIFEDAAQGEVSEEIDRERIAIPDYVRRASLLLRPLGEPIARQFRVEQWLDGIEVPFVGYVDYLWADTLLDLKTTLRLPSAPREDHAVQVVSYGDATGRTPGLAYVTPKKGIIYSGDQIDATEARRTMMRGARAIRSLLATVATKEQAAALFAPSFDSFYWTEATTKAALQIWT